MKRTSHARFVAIGIARPEWIDKYPVHGTVFKDVAAELAGIGHSVTCECGSVLAVESGRSAKAILNKHLKTKSHQP